VSIEGAEFFAARDRPSAPVELEPAPAGVGVGAGDDR
jgi:ribosomal protein S5